MTCISMITGGVPESIVAVLPKDMVGWSHQRAIVEEELKLSNFVDVLCLFRSHSCQTKA